MRAATHRNMDRYDTGLLESRVRTGAWRYRLGVRTRGSQPRDRGSIPRTATTKGATYVRPSGVNLSGPASTSQQQLPAVLNVLLRQLLTPTVDVPRSLLLDSLSVKAQ